MVIDAVDRPLSIAFPGEKSNFRHFVDATRSQGLAMVRGIEENGS
jgi:hypothetical protein